MAQLHVHIWEVGSCPRIRANCILLYLTSNSTTAVSIVHRGCNLWQAMLCPGQVRGGGCGQHGWQRVFITDLGYKCWCVGVIKSRPDSSQLYNVFKMIYRQCSTLLPAPQVDHCQTLLGAVYVVGSFSKISSFNIRANPEREVCCFSSACSLIRELRCNWRPCLKVPGNALENHLGWSLDGR